MHLKSFQTSCRQRSAEDHSNKQNFHRERIDWQVQCTQHNSWKSSQLVKTQTVLFVCLIVRYTVGSCWIEVNKDAASAHKNKHELIIPTSLLNSTIPAHVRREEHKALVVKRCFLPCFDLLSFWVSASFSSLKQHAGWTWADRGGRLLFWWFVFSPPLFSGDYRHMMTAAQHNAGGKVSGFTRTVWHAVLNRADNTIHVLCIHW